MGAVRSRRRLAARLRVRTSCSSPGLGARPRLVALRPRRRARPGRRRCCLSRARVRDRGRAASRGLLVGAGVTAWTLGEIYYTAVLWTRPRRRRSRRRPTPATCLLAADARPGLVLLRARAAGVPRRRSGPTAPPPRSRVSARLRGDRLRDRARVASPAQPLSVALEPRLRALRPRPDRRHRRRPRGHGLALDRTLGAARRSGSSMFWLADSMYLVQTAQGRL